MAFRNILIKECEGAAKSLMTGDLEIEYTGEIYYDVKTDDQIRIIGHEYSPHEGDIYYGCSCELRKIKSFKKVP